MSKNDTARAIRSSIITKGLKSYNSLWKQRGYLTYCNDIFTHTQNARKQKNIIPQTSLSSSNGKSTSIQCLPRYSGWDGKSSQFSRKMFKTLHTREAKNECNHANDLNLKALPKNIRLYTNLQKC